MSARHMKASIYEKLREEGYDVHRCAPGSDGNCYYLISERRDWDYGDKDGRIFKAVRETPTGDLESGATLAFFVSRSAQATAKIKGLMGDFESFVENAGVASIRELLKGDLSSTPHQDIELNSRSPDEAFTLPAEPYPLAEQRDLRFKILRILAEKHSAGSKRVSKDALLEELCTNIDWVDKALVILGEKKFVDGALRGDMKLLTDGYLETEKTIPQSASVVAPAPEPVQDEEAATAAAADVSDTRGAKGARRLVRAQRGVLAIYGYAFLLGTADRPQLEDADEQSLIDEFQAVLETLRQELARQDDEIAALFDVIAALEGETAALKAELQDLRIEAEKAAHLGRRCYEKFCLAFSGVLGAGLAAGAIYGVSEGGKYVIGQFGGEIFDLLMGGLGPAGEGPSVPAPDPTVPI